MVELHVEGDSGQGFDRRSLCEEAVGYPVAVEVTLEPGSWKSSLQR